MVTPQPTEESPPPTSPSSLSSTTAHQRTTRRRHVSLRRLTKKVSTPGTRTTLKTWKKKPTTIEDKPTSVGTMLGRATNTSCSLLRSIYRTLVWPLRWILMVVLPHTLGGILTLLFLVLAVYLLGISFKNVLGRMVLSTSNLGVMVVKPLRAMAVPTVYFYCSILRGPFCGERSGPKIQIGQVARTVSGTAQQASDIFDSVLLLSDPTHLGLHQTEILELAFAVRWSSDLHDKTALADGLSDLSDLTRQLKDQLIDLNGKGLNTFSFIAYQFSRLGDLIEWVQSGKKAYTSKTIQQNLDILFEDLTVELSQLLNTIEGLIPLASRSTHLGVQISERLHRQHYQLIDEKSNQGLWKKLLDITSFQARQLNHDLDLTATSIQNLRSTWLKLENIRTDLLTYRNNVANFKASFTGWHLADHGLKPEDELLSMREVIERFQLTLKTVKSNSRSTTTQSSSSSSSTKPHLLSTVSPT